MGRADGVRDVGRKAGRVIGGYRNEGVLTAEHLKLPVTLQRRVGARIEVRSVSNDSVVYRNLLSGRVMEFRLLHGEWRYVRDLNDEA